MAYIILSGRPINYIIHFVFLIFATEAFFLFFFFCVKCITHSVSTDNILVFFETFQIVLECVDKLVLEVYQNELVRKTRTISYSLLNVVLGLKIWCEKNSLQPKSYNMPTCTVTYQTTTCSIIFPPLAFYRIQRCNLLTSPLITRNIMIKCKRCSIHSRPPWMLCLALLLVYTYASPSQAKFTKYLEHLFP